MSFKRFIFIEISLVSTATVVTQDCKISYLIIVMKRLAIKCK